MIGGNCPNAGAGLYLIFDKGRVEVDGWGGGWINVFKAGVERVKYPPITGHAQSPNDNFIDAILGRSEPRTSPANGIIQSELMDAIYESARTGEVVRVKR
jgi:predicted dehydrogenase